MEYASRGAKALANSDPATAVVEYTRALIEHPTSPDYYTQRSIALSRVKPARWDLALQDAETAVLAGHKRGKKDAIQAAQQRRLVCLYNLGRYADAKVILDSMPKPDEKQKSKQMEQSIWATKIQAKLKDASGLQTATVGVNVEGSLPEASVQKKIVQKQLKKDGTFNYDGVEEEEVVQSKGLKPGELKESIGEDAVSRKSEASSDSTAVPASSSIAKIRHEWYQSSTAITLTIYAKNVSKDQAEIEINADSVHISFPQPQNPSTTYNFSVDPLFALIDPSQSSSKVMGTKVELNLAKAMAGQKWANLEGTVPLTAHTNGEDHDNDKSASRAVMASLQNPPATQSTTETGPVYPTSSRSGPKNWDKLANDLTKSKSKSKSKAKAKDADNPNPNPNPKPKQKGKQKANADDDDDNENENDDDDEIDYSAESGDEVDGFFKKLYKGSDPDTQRAMMKSMYESNGTTLSTSWADVGRRRVKPYEEKEKDGE